MRQQWTPCQRELIVSAAGKLVGEGFLTDKQIEKRLVKHADEVEGLRDIGRLINNVVDQLSGMHAYEEQENWKTPTDNDKLENAAELLTSEGIVFQIMYQCCLRCHRWKDIVEKLTGSTDDQEVKGYAFCLHEDVCEALETNVLHVSFGTKSGDFHEEMVGFEEDGAIGKKVVAALKKVGLEPEWNGDPDTRIRLVNFVWRKRREGLSS